MVRSNKKNFLFISNYPMDDSSSASIRNKALIEGLIQLGFEAYTLTRKGHIKNYNQIYFENTSLAYKIAKSVNKEQSSFLWKMRVSIAKKLESLSLYGNQKILLKNLDKLIFEKHEYDFVISSSDSKVSHLICEKLIKRNKIKTNNWIQYWGDPFYNDINKSTILPDFLVKIEEERILRQAKLIYYTSPFTLEDQKRLYDKESRKMNYIPTPYINERIYKPSYKEKLVIGYYGSYFKSDRNIIPLYNTASKMESIDFEFVGSSDLKLSNEKNISIIERVPYEEILEYEEKCDILVCIANKPGTSQIPGKMYHYAATNKPILFIYEKEDKKIANFFKKFNRYYFCENNEESISNKIEKIIKDKDVKYSPIEGFSCVKVASDIIENLDL